MNLVMKFDSPSVLGDLWYISIIRYLYKLVAKVLVARLAKIMDKLIFPNL